MDGVNNTFCSSKEEYEIARLTTKCAGLQGKIDEQAAEIEKYKALCDQMSTSASDLPNTAAIVAISGKPRSNSSRSV